MVSINQKNLIDLVLINSQKDDKDKISIIEATTMLQKGYVLFEVTGVYVVDQRSCQ